MSHFATNWAIRQRGIKPGLKVVLWHLADCHNPAYGGTFPSQEYLSDQCEIPRSTLNNYLDQLEATGLIAREQRRKEGSHKQERTRYYFPFEEQFARFSTVKPSPETGHGEADPESRNQADPSPENGDSRVQNLDSNPVREPVKEPVIEREARERDGDDRKKIERQFKRWYPTWPTYVADSERDARKVWSVLTPDEREACLAKTGAYVAAVKASGRTKFCTASVYLTRKDWEKLEDPASEIAPPTVHNAFSRAWSAKRIAELLRPVAEAMPAPTVWQRAQVAAGGDAAAAIIRERRQRYGWPKVNMMHQRAIQGQGVVVSNELVANSLDFVPVRRGSAEAGLWQALHDRMGWPWLPDIEAVEWLYFPPGEPGAAIEVFRAATSEGRGHDDAA